MTFCIPRNASSVLQLHSDVKVKGRKIQHIVFGFFNPLSNVFFLSMVPIKCTCFIEKSSNQHLPYEMSFSLIPQDIFIFQLYVKVTEKFKIAPTIDVGLENFIQQDTEIDSTTTFISLNDKLLSNSKVKEKENSKMI